LTKNRRHDDGGYEQEEEESFHGDRVELNLTTPADEFGIQEKERLQILKVSGF
jgi:hypothetical protein